MDISVGRLNNRMALQVPSELPLGLVFITGRVEQLSPPPETAVAGAATQQQISFNLVDEQHRLRCRVPRQVVEETQVEEGNRIRVSGHLLFDSSSVHYYLSARDLEVLSSIAPEESPVPAVAPATTTREEETATLVKSELPAWVKQLAPPEVKDEYDLEEEPAAGEMEELQDTRLPAEMLAFLSSAIDSDEEIELTREMIGEYLPEAEARQPTAEQEEPQTAAPESVGEGLQEIATPAGAEAEEREKEAPTLVPDPAAGEGRRRLVLSDNMRWLLIFVAVVVFLGLLLVLMFIAWSPL